MKIAKRILSALLAAATLLSVCAVAASAAPDFKKAEEMNFMLPTLVSPTGKEQLGGLASGSKVYSFTAPRNGSYVIRSGSLLPLNLYPFTTAQLQPAGFFLNDKYVKNVFLNAIFNICIYFFSIVIVVPRWIYLGFLAYDAANAVYGIVNIFMPDNKPSMQLYDSKQKLIGEAQPGDGFPGLAPLTLPKWSEFDFRFVCELKGGKTYYIVVDTEDTFFDLPYTLSVWPTILPF